jgi:2-polyprenyl-6-methoxyphenol hydroxylase-like FAD-dependent oxidoreductase
MQVRGPQSVDAGSWSTEEPTHAAYRSSRRARRSPDRPAALSWGILALCPARDRVRRCDRRCRDRGRGPVRSRARQRTGSPRRPRRALRRQAVDGGQSAGERHAGPHDGALPQARLRRRGTQPGLPDDFPTDIAYFTRFTTHELATFRLPSAREARERVTTLSGSWSAAELTHRVSQKYVEQVLRRHAEALPGVSINYGWRLTDFAETEEAVSTTVEQVDGDAHRRITARYLVGADGARSHVRKRLEIVWTGETGVVRDFFGGRMYAIYLRSPRFYDVVPHPPAWMNVTFNRDRRAFVAAVDGKGEFAFHTQLREGEDRERASAADAAGLFHAAAGARIDATTLSCDTWTAGHALVADRFRRGRILLGGDAAHLFTPAGGLGYNTAVEDAVNLGWKLAATVKGIAGPRLLESYELVRRPAAVRNTGMRARSPSR